MHPASSKGESNEIPPPSIYLILCASIQPLSGTYSDVELYKVDALENSPSLEWGDLLLIALMSGVDYNVSTFISGHPMDSLPHLIDGAPRVYHRHFSSGRPIWVQKDPLPGSGHKPICQIHGVPHQVAQGFV